MKCAQNLGSTRLPSEEALEPELQEARGGTGMAGGDWGEHWRTQQGLQEELELTAGPWHFIRALANTSSFLLPKQELRENRSVNQHFSSPQFIKVMLHIFISPFLG